MEHLIENVLNFDTYVSSNIDINTKTHILGDKISVINFFVCYSNFSLYVMKFNKVELFILRFAIYQYWATQSSITFILVTSGTSVFTLYIN